MPRICRAWVQLCTAERAVPRTRDSAAPASWRSSLQNKQSDAAEWPQLCCRAVGRKDDRFVWPTDGLLTHFFSLLHQHSTSRDGPNRPVACRALEIGRLPLPKTCGNIWSCTATGICNSKRSLITCRLVGASGRHGTPWLCTAIAGAAGPGCACCALACKRPDMQRKRRHLVPHLLRQRQRAQLQRESPSASLWGSLCQHTCLT